MGIVRQDSDESRPQSLRSFAIGFAVICFAYVIPILGFITWTLMGVFGLGTAALTFISAYRRENPAPPPRLAPLTPPAFRRRRRRRRRYRRRRRSRRRRNTPKVRHLRHWWRPTALHSPQRRPWHCPAPISPRFRTQPLPIGLPRSFSTSSWS